LRGGGVWYAGIFPRACACSTSHRKSGDSCTLWLLRHCGLSYLYCNSCYINQFYQVFWYFISRCFYCFMARRNWILSQKSVQNKFITQYPEFSFTSALFH
jgi:hypothetical protein